MRDALGALEPVARPLPTVLPISYSQASPWRGPRPAPFLLRTQVKRAGFTERTSEAASVTLQPRALASLSG
jgi:hypothetical protein